VILFFSFLIAMFITMALIPPLIKSAARLQFVDIPDARKVHVQAVPRIGGVAIVVGAMLPILLWLPLHREVTGFLVGATIIFIFGVWDDRKELNYRLKFMGQFLAILAVVGLGGVTIKFIPFAGLDPVSSYIAIPLTVISLLGITNAINLSDGLDGLAGGASLLSFGIIALLGYMVSDTQVVMIALAVIGSILGFLRFNTYPAQVFMGDTGSQFLGFSVGVLVILLTQNVNTALSPALPLLILGLPILDTIMVMVQRLLEGNSPFSADQKHIHHKLLALHFDHYEVVFIIYFIQSILVLGAFYFRYQSDAIIVGSYIVFCASVLMFFQWSEKYGWQARSEDKPRMSAHVVGKIRGLRDEGRFSRWAFLFSAGTIPLYLLYGVLSCDEITTDISLLAAGLLCVWLLVSFIRRNQSINWFERIGIYITSSIIVYLIESSGLSHTVSEVYLNLYFILLGLAVVVGFRFSREKIFVVTTLDFLVIFAVFTVPSLPGLSLSESLWSSVVIRMIVLFYAVEFVLTHINKNWNGVRYIMIIILGVMGFRIII